MTKYVLKYYNNLTPDGELWNDLREDVETAFIELTKRYYRKLIHYGQKLTHHGQLVEDALQDLMINLWLHRKSIGDAPSVKYYLMKAFRNQLFKTIANDSKNGKWPDDVEDIQAEMFYEELFIIDEEDELRKEVSKLLGRLPARQREVMYLRFYQELTPNQIASFLAIKPQSVSNVIQRALNNLRQDLLKISTIDHLITKQSTSYFQINQ